MKYTPENLLHVYWDTGENRQKVGRLAYKDRLIHFEYDADFISSSVELSPFQLAKNPGVITGKINVFEGLHGVFYDSLPDGWGRLLLDRKLRQTGIEPGQLNPLDRLAFVGTGGMGALSYEPDHNPPKDNGEKLDLDQLANDTQKIIEGETGAVIDELLALNGSSAGARPKIIAHVSADLLTLIHGAEQVDDGFSGWIIKFPSSVDPNDIAAIEYAYSQMAQDSGVEMTSTHLFPAKSGPGYFGTQRFDRQGNTRIHMHTPCGLLDADHRIPSLDYKLLLKATFVLTKDMRQVEKVFRLATFNVFSHNRDDHSKNFSFLMDENGLWQASPAYDLTFSSGPGGEHSTMVMGEGRGPGKKHLLELAESAGITKKVALEIIEQTNDVIAKWQSYASTACVSDASLELIQKHIDKVR